MDENPIAIVNAAVISFLNLLFMASPPIKHLYYLEILFPVYQNASNFDRVNLNKNTTVFPFVLPVIRVYKNYLRKYIRIPRAINSKPNSFRRILGIISLIVSPLNNNTQNRFRNKQNDLLLIHEFPKRPH